MWFSFYSFVSFASYVKLVWLASECVPIRSLEWVLSVFMDRMGSSGLWLFYQLEFDYFAAETGMQLTVRSSMKIRDLGKLKASVCIYTRVYIRIYGIYIFLLGISFAIILWRCGRCPIKKKKLNSNRSLLIQIQIQTKLNCVKLRILFSSFPPINIHL